MTITATFAHPFYTGSGSSGLVPWPFPVALAGRPYMLDTANEAWSHRSIPVTRPQSDDSAEPGEATINREGLWRKSQSSWHKGAGQWFLDREESDAARFHHSKGVNPWERNKLTLLPDTGQKLASANTNLDLVPAGGYLYAADGNALKRTADITAGTPTWTTVTGTHASSISGLASDGYNVWVANGANGTFATTRGAAAATAYNATPTTLLGYVKGRLMGAHNNVVTNITGAGTQTTVITADNTDFTWIGFAAGKAVIYAAGFSGDKSLVYRIGIKDDGTGLDAGIVAAELPDGEIVRSISGYLGRFVFLGTDAGVRFAVADTTGDLELGALIETESAVRCFEPQEEFIWFGWTDYDTTSTGLGRMTPKDLNDSAPAYASDLMVTAQGPVVAVATFQDRRVFSVSGVGVYAEEATLVAEGTLDTGDISFGIADDKIAIYLDLRHEYLNGTVGVGMSTDGGPFVEMGSSVAVGSTLNVIPTRQTRGELFEVRLTLTRAEVLGPSFLRYTLRANPTANTGEYLFIPFLLLEQGDVDGEPYWWDVAGESRSIKGLRQTRRIVSYQEPGASYSVTVEDYEWQPHGFTNERDGTTGTLVAKLKVVE